MRTSQLFTLISLFLVASLLAVACAAPVAPAPAPAAPAGGEEAPPEPAQKAGTITVWSRYDINATDDPNGVRMKELIDKVQAETGLEVRHETVAFDQLATKLALAVQSGGDVPDVVETGSQMIPPLLDAGALMPLDDILAGQSWVDELTEGDVRACVREGQRYCVATNVRGGITYYRNDAFPNGLPLGQDEWLAEAERLKAEGLYAKTFFAGRSYAAIETGWWPLIKSNGGSLFDAEGKPAWASPEVAEVAAWAQQMYANEYFPILAVTGEFADAEAPWMEGQAAAFGGGSWSAIFVPGLMDDFEAGNVGMAGGISFNGGDPAVFMVSEGWTVPMGAKNPEGAVIFLTAFMEPEFLASWAESQYGIPTTEAAYNMGQFEGSQFYQNVDNILGTQGAYMEASPFYVESLDILAVTWQELMLDPSKDPATELERAANEVMTRYWN